MNWFRPKPSIEAEFDIEGMDVFSVERDADGSTRFGYVEQKQKIVTDRLADGSQQSRVVRVAEIEEWGVSTTDDQHRAFVARLAVKLHNINQSPILEDNDKTKN